MHNIGEQNIEDAKHQWTKYQMQNIERRLSNANYGK